MACGETHPHLLCASARGGLGGPLTGGWESNQVSPTPSPLTRMGCVWPKISSSTRPGSSHHPMSHALPREDSCPWLPFLVLSTPQAWAQSGSCFDQYLHVGVKLHTCALLRGFPMEGIRITNWHLLTQWHLSGMCVYMHVLALSELCA